MCNGPFTSTVHCPGNVWISEARSDNYQSMRSTELHMWGFFIYFENSQEIGIVGLASSGLLAGLSLFPTSQSGKGQGQLRSPGLTWRTPLADSQQSIAECARPISTADPRNFNLLHWRNREQFVECSRRRDQSVFSGPT